MILRVDISAASLQELEIVIADSGPISTWLYQLPKLKWMQCTSAGVDYIFEQLQNDKPSPSYLLTRFGGVLGPPMAEYVIGQIIAGERKFKLSWKYQQSKKW